MIDLDIAPYLETWSEHLKDITDRELTLLAGDYCWLVERHVNTAASRRLPNSAAPATRNLHLLRTSASMQKQLQCEKAGSQVFVGFLKRRSECRYFSGERAFASFTHVSYTY